MRARMSCASLGMEGRRPGVRVSGAEAARAFEEGTGASPVGLCCRRMLRGGVDMWWDEDAAELEVAMGGSGFEICRDGDKVVDKD